MEIPLSSVITAQPSVDQSSISNRVDESALDQDFQSGNRLIGLGPLQSTSKLTLKQRIRACEIISLITGCEVEKKFNIHGDAGEVLYTAKESSNCMARFCCGNIRNLNINVFDQTGKNVIQLSRPLNCAGLCCNVCYPICTQAISVSVNGEGIGTIRERATWIYPVYHIFDSLGTQILKVRGPFCHYGCCGKDVPFIVTRIDSSSMPDHVATVTKKWGGFCKETVLDADNFQLDFNSQKNVSLQEKILILATTFLIDLMYFENDG